MLRAITILLYTSALLYAGDQNAASTKGPETKAGKRFVIVDSDGHRQVFQFPAGSVTEESTHFGSGRKSDDALRPVLSDTVRPIIGVRCHPIGQLLRTHLKLEHGGVVISGISPGLPADQAGLVVGDILLSVNSTTTGNPRALAAAVEASANEEMTVQYLHAGDRQTVAITAESLAPSQILKLDDSLLRSGSSSPIFINGFGPAMQLDGAADLDQQITELLQEMRAKSSDTSPAQDTKDFTRELDKLRVRMAELEERLLDGRKPSIESKQ